ncbi:MAG: thioredoxin domain-containing protein [Rubripirellula sp.]|nr:thioredoxin domain-containing protein [Rubripirellula sp.]
MFNLPRFVILFALLAGVLSSIALGQESSSESAPQTNGNAKLERHDEAHQNRLAGESSPYLLQHAGNPVDWYPWGTEAFEKAKRENKLVFLSVGYAACHWCHVMERESFEDSEIAEVLNERFVCVKVDREERPDIDQIYMTAVQLITGQGGWPMSVFILPNAKPFWGGTYFPARDGDRGTATGFLTIAKQIDRAWKEQTDQVKAQADAVTEAIQSQQLPVTDDPELLAYDERWIDKTLSELRDQYDSTNGGFTSGGEGPKFPEPSNLRFLLEKALADASLHEGDQAGDEPKSSGELETNGATSPERDTSTEQGRFTASEMLRGTLDGMIRGGMYDHLGGGFHRYSVDQRWQIPHFEKMLYDNAQLASIFAEASILLQSDEYQIIAEGICDFLLREMRSQEGGFYSSIDADSEGEEGKFYRWTREELDALRPLEQYATFAKLYGLDRAPNFESEYFVLAPPMNLGDAADSKKQTIPEMLDSLRSVSISMLEKRNSRVKPPTDTKILTAWNGLTIAALADVGRLLKRKDYLRASVECLDLIMRESRDAEGRLLRSYARGQAKLQGYLDDYAFLVAGILALHRAVDEPRLLELAAELTDEQIQWFWDSEQGGFFFTASDHQETIVRLKHPIDGAVPSGISVSAENLHALIGHQLQGGSEQRAEKYRVLLIDTVRSVMPLVSRAPVAATRMGSVAIRMQTSSE